MCIFLDKQEDLLTKTKRRVFWRAIQAIAEQENASEDAMSYEEQERCCINKSLNCLMDNFPLHSKNAGQWLPMHFAVCVPDISVTEIRTLFINSSSSLSQSADPINANTPLHLAVMSSATALVVRELVQLYPLALEMKNNDDHIPLCLIGYNKSLEAPNILRVLLDAAPHTAATPTYTATATYSMLQNFLPLHAVLHYNTNITPETVGILIAAYQNAVNIATFPDNIEGQQLPIHYAAEYASLEVFKLLDDMNPANLSVIAPYTIGSVAHRAVVGRKFDTLRYIHTRMPQLLTAECRNRQASPLFHLVSHLNNFSNDAWDLNDPLSVGSDILRYLLPHYSPEMLLAHRDPFHDGEQLLDRYLTAEDYPDCSYARRLLLAAGARSSRDPSDELREMNYAARRGALLAFFPPPPPPPPPAAVHQNHQDQMVVVMNIFQRIRHGPAGAELVRKIVCFL